MAKPKYIQIFMDNDEFLNLLTDTEAGQLFKALLAFANTGASPAFESKSVEILFRVMSAQIRRDFENYSKKCEKLSENAKKRYAKSANASVCSQDKDEEKDKEKDKNKEKDEDKDYDNDKDNGLFVGKADGADSLSQNIFYQNVTDSYNSVCTSMPRLIRMSDKRKKAVDRARQVLDGTSFEEYFQRVEESDFLTGRSGAWSCCGFDWLMREENIIKVLEGNYDNKAMQSKAKDENISRSYDIDELEKINYLDTVRW